MGWVGILLVTLACGLSTPEPAPQTGVETIVAETLQSITASAVPMTEAPAISEGAVVSANSVKFSIPLGLGTSANVESVTAENIEEGPSSGQTPAHTKFSLTGYPLQGKFFEPHILVYPAAEYESVNEGAAYNLQKLRAILASPSAPLTKEMMPGITSFNAGMVFTSNMQVISFQNGTGVRFLTQYAQYLAAANNNDLFYEFQGLTNDGKYYIIAILPVNVPFFAADSNIPQTSLPADGILFTGEGPDEAYYTTVVDRLNQTAPEVFTPSILLLDALIQSIVTQ
jgi:hypothetical protein